MHTLLFGAVVGAMSGLMFAILMLYAMTLNGGSFRVDEEAAGPFLSIFARALGPTGFLFFVSIPPFTALGAWLGYRVWGLMEDRYQALLQAGARIPLEKPVRSAKERFADRAVLGGFLLLSLFLFAMLVWEIRGGAM